MQVKRKRKKVYFIFPLSFEKTMVAQSKDYKSLQIKYTPPH